MSGLIPYGLVTLVSFVLNFCWEWAHIGLYKDYEALGGGISLTLWATAGDVLYTIVGVVLIAVFFRNHDWLASPSQRHYIGAAFYGFCIALFVEWKAAALHRWAYTDAMPIIPWLNVGASPIVQMALLVPFTCYIVVLLERYFKKQFSIT
jgi:glycopeptide antibiotics resistance protein